MGILTVGRGAVSNSSAWFWDATGSPCPALKHGKVLSLTETWHVLFCEHPWEAWPFLKRNWRSEFRGWRYKGMRVRDCEERREGKLLPWWLKTCVRAAIIIAVKCVYVNCHKHCVTHFQKSTKVFGWLSFFLLGNTQQTWRVVPKRKTIG